MPCGSETGLWDAIGEIDVVDAVNRKSESGSASSCRCSLPQTSEGFQLPFVRRTVVPKDIEIAVIRADFEEDLTWPVPLVENFFDDEFALPHLKFHWPLVRFSTGVALYPQHHRRKFLLQRPILTVARIHRVAMKRPFN